LSLKKKKSSKERKEKFESMMNVINSKSRGQTNKQNWQLEMNIKLINVIKITAKEQTKKIQQ